MTAYDFDLDRTTDAASRYASPTSSWKDEIIYFAMLDRFCDGDSSNNKQGVSEVEDSPKMESNYSGGDFQGLINKMNEGYFTKLGITTIWVTPPIKNQWYEGNYGGYHGYWASDFTKVDPHVGDLAKYKEFVALAHSNGIRVIQDIVVNHTGDYFGVKDTPYAYGSTNWSLNPVSKPTAAPEQMPWTLNNPGIFSEEELQYNSFYHWTPAISDFNDATQTYTYQESNLDDINTDNTNVANLLRGYFRYWIDKVDIDGYRVDTVKYVNPTFFEGFVNSTDAGNLGVREYAKSLGKSDFILFGEAWDPSDTLCASYTKSADTGANRLDSMIYFPLNTATRDVFGSGNKTSELTEVLNRRYSSGYANPDKLVTFVDNHDMARMSSIASSNLNRAAYAFIMTIPGIPQIYYGAENELSVCRRAMFAGGYQGPNLDVNSTDLFDSSSSNTMFTYLHDLIALRKANSVFRNGTVSVLRDSSLGTGIFAYKVVETAGTVNKEAFVIFNTSSKELVAANISGLTEGGNYVLKNPSINMTTTNFTAQSGGKMSMIVPAEAFGIYVLNTTGNALTTPANTVSITSTYSTVSTTTLPVLGIVGNTIADVNMSIFFDGDMSSATMWTIPAGTSDLSWVKSLSLLSLSGKAHDVTVAINNGGVFSFSDPVPFSLVPAMIMRTSITDPQGDDTGPAGYNYTLPQNSTFNGHLEDILGVSVSTWGSNMDIKIQMRGISTVWAPTVNMFDHVFFNIFLRKNGSTSTVNALPLYHYNIPFCWDYQIKEEGWSSAMTNNVGASATARGKTVTPAPSCVVDAVNNTITFSVSGSAIGSPDSFEGWQVYIADWDLDMGNARGLTPDGGNWVFGGGDGSVDPLVLDETSVITIPAYTE